MSIPPRDTSKKGTVTRSQAKKNPSIAKQLKKVPNYHLNRNEKIKKILQRIHVTNGQFWFDPTFLKSTIPFKDLKRGVMKEEMRSNCLSLFVGGPKQPK